MTIKISNYKSQISNKLQILNHKFKDSKTNWKLENGNWKINGFTLIELLVVISIIGILAALGMVSFTNSQRQARDSARRSDIKQYQTSIEAYANKSNGLFPSRPVAAGVDAATTLCTDLGLTTCPEDVKRATDATFAYKYQSNGTVSNGAATATLYVLWAKLENTTNYFVTCSNGKAGTRPQSGFSVSGGNCPL